MFTSTHGRKGASKQGTKHSSKGALLISPLPLSSLSDHICPICHETYTEPPAPNQDASPDQDFAISVDMVAEWHGSKRLCGHVLGRQCFEKHLRSRGAWRNKCPLCRDVWFQGNQAEEEVSDQQAQEDAHHVPEQTTTPPRRSARIASRTSVDRNTSPERMSARSGVDRARCRQQRPSALEVRADGDEVTGTMGDVERRLHTLYRDMER
ncbi:hypothetical protein DE146DRAFT_744417 [Phaeosphaeria sp. MPI-PUGE-AT-0046c]|nr:hypothetical protein DE146DRAFT_744417 [Phaeosphaeria sp. MPI-PUGE-AT-0046c]